MSLHSANCARRLVAWRDAELAQLRRLLQDGVDAWRVEWGLTPHWRGPIGCACESPSAADTPWECLVAEPGASTWLAPGDCTADALAQALVGATTVTPLLRELGDACRRDLHDRMRAVLRLRGSGKESSAMPAAPGRWSGNVVAALPCRAQLLIEAVAVERLLCLAPAMRCTTGGIVPLADAFADMACPLQVRLEGCDLDLGALQDLQPGDVLRLRHRLDLPASVYGESGGALFKGFLARSRGRKALELAPLSSEPLERKKVLA